MKRMMLLTGVLLRNQLGISMLEYNRQNDKRAFTKQIFLMVGVPLLCLPALVVYFIFSGALYVSMAAIGQTLGYIGLFYAMASILVLVFGVAWVLSEFYFSEGVTQLLSLPIRPREIIMAKLCCVLLWEYVFSILIMVPPLIIWGASQGVFWLWYLPAAVLVVAALPILPIALEAALMMVILGAGNLKGKKDVISVVMMFAFLALILGVQFTLGSAASSMDESQLTTMLTQLLENNTGLLDSIIRIFPPAYLAARALMGEGLMSLACLVGVVGLSVLSIFLLIWVGERFYIKGLLEGGMSATSKGKKNQKGIAGLLGRHRGSALRIFQMDFRLLLRTPIFFFNNVSIAIVIPLCLIFVIFMAKGGSGGEIEQAIQFLYQYPEFLILALGLVFLFFGATSATTATSFSREGKGIWITRIIPVAPQAQVIGRCVSALCIQALGIVMTFIMLSFIIGLSPQVILLSTLCGIGCALPIQLMGLLIDMHRPLLHWDNPQRAVKNNLNVIFTMLLGMCYTVILVVLGGSMGYFISPWAGCGAVLSLSAVLSIILYKVCVRQLPRCLLKCDE